MADTATPAASPATSPAATPATGPVDVVVRYTCGAYVTATVRGQRCSSTSSAATAAAGLAAKLWPGARRPTVDYMGHQAAGVSTWRLQAAPPKGAPR